MKLKLKKSSLFFLIVYALIAILGPIISNEKAIICKTSNQIHFPIFENNLKQYECTWYINPIIPYSYNSIDSKNRAKGPFDQQDIDSIRYRHWLGTDALGRDVLAGLINGVRISFIVGFLSLLIAVLFSAFFAYLSSIIGNGGLTINWMSFLIILLGIVVFLFYIFYGYLFTAIIIFSILLFIARLIAVYFSNLKHITIAFDFIILKYIELSKTIPALFFLLFLLTVFKTPGYKNIIIIIAILSIPGLTRFMRGELIKIKSTNYYKSATALGLRSHQLFVRHGLPNALQPILVALAFGFGSTVMLEATLSFLGLGIPPEEVSWGSMLSEARRNFRLWWMVVFPGLAIFFVILRLNKIGEELTEL